MESIWPAGDATGRAGRLAAGAGAVALTALVWWLSDQSDPNPTSGVLATITAQTAHLVVFGVLFLLWRAATGHALLAAALAIGYGAIDELHQTTTPGRDATVVDVLFDAAGVALAAAALRARRHGARGLHVHSRR
jgi:VanZ family protein